VETLDGNRVFDISGGTVQLTGLHITGATFKSDIDETLRKRDRDQRWSAVCPGASYYWRNPQETLIEGDDCMVKDGGECWQPACPGDKSYYEEHYFYGHPLCEGEGKCVAAAARTDQDAGALYISGDDTAVTLTNCEIYENAAFAGGAGLRIDGGTVTLNDCKIRDNTVGGYDNTGYDSGGVGFHISGGEVTLYNCEIRDNTATYVLGGFQGGGIFISGGKVTLDDECDIHGNNAGLSQFAMKGAGIYLSDHLRCKGAVNLSRKPTIDTSSQPSIEEQDSNSRRLSIEEQDPNFNLVGEEVCKKEADEKKAE